MMTCMAVITVFLSGCGNPPSQENQKSAVQELKARGFTDPRWETDAATYTVGVGSCRFPIRKGSSDWVIELPGTKIMQSANLEILRSPDNSKKAGIEACFKE